MFKNNYHLGFARTAVLVSLPDSYKTVRDRQITNRVHIDRTLGRIKHISENGDIKSDIGILMEAQNQAMIDNMLLNMQRNPNASNGFALETPNQDVIDTIQSRYCRTFDEFKLDLLGRMQSRVEREAKVEQIRKINENRKKIFDLKNEEK